MNKKICILTDSLSSGGAEKVAANMSISLTKKGYNVFVVAMMNNIDYSYEGTLFNFGLVKENFNSLKALFKFWSFFKTEKFEVIIDHRTRNTYLKELILSKFIIPKTRVLYCVHSYIIEYYFSFIKIPFLAKLPHTKNRSFVAVSNEISILLQQKLKIKCKTIYNYFSVNKLSKVLETRYITETKYIIGVGRLSKIKQFDILIKSYYKSRLVENDILLYILGDGSEKESLKSLISKLDLNNYVKILPFTEAPYNLIRGAKSLVLSSKVEGFPMALLEALTLNVPVIAFNCKSGPDEIIINEKNGLLIEDQNDGELTKALNKLLLDEDYYKSIRANTHVGLDKFSEGVIVQEWIDLIEKSHK